MKRRRFSTLITAKDSPWNQESNVCSCSFVWVCAGDMAKVNYQRKHFASVCVCVWEGVVIAANEAKSWVQICIQKLCCWSLCLLSSFAHRDRSINTCTHEQNAQQAHKTALHSLMKMTASLKKWLTPSLLHKHTQILQKKMVAHLAGCLKREF